MKNNNKKGQAAIEFLVTYGWAIMAAMVVIGALTYFGMTNPSTSLPDKCIFSNAFGCKDYQLTESTIRLKVTNTIGETIYGPIYANCTDPDPASTTCNCNSIDINGNKILAGGYLEPEGELQITCTGPPDSPFNQGEKAKVKLTITYKKNPDVNAYNQVSLGEVYATVQNE